MRLLMGRQHMWYFRRLVAQLDRAALVVTRSKRHFHVPVKAHTAHPRLPLLPGPLPHLRQRSAQIRLDAITVQRWRFRVHPAPISTATTVITAELPPSGDANPHSSDRQAEPSMTPPCVHMGTERLQL